MMIGLFKRITHANSFEQNASNHNRGIRCSSKSAIKCASSCNNSVKSKSSRSRIQNDTVPDGRQITVDIDNSNHVVDNTKDINHNDDDASSCLSSLSFYEDFPELYFAVRRGRYVNNCVFLTWDAARKHIVDYPDAEYIATPTLKQAYSYTNRFGEFHGDKEYETDSEDSESEKSSVPNSKSGPTKSKKTTLKKQSHPSTKPYSTRRLVLEYYDLYDPKGKEDSLTIEKFLKERDLYKSKFRVVCKHWQRSGLLMMANEEKPREEAIQKYATWVQDRKDEKMEEEEEQSTTDTRKRKSSAGDVSDGERSNGMTPPSKKKRKKSETVSSSNRTKPKCTKKKKGKNNKNNRSPSTSVLKTATIVGLPNSALSTDSDEADDDDEDFNDMYEKLKAYHAEHGHCKVSRDEDPQLAYFVAYTRRRMKPENNRAGAKSLTIREEGLLNDLDFDPLYKEIVTEFNKYLGMRVVKMFDVKVDNEDDEEPTIQATPFFGTVGRISSVCNRYLRIKYDDGDSEDYDKAGLLEGIKLYNKYKKQDTLSGATASDGATVGTASRRDSFRSATAAAIAAVERSENKCRNTNNEIDADKNGESTNETNKFVTPRPEKRGRGWPRKLLVDRETAKRTNKLVTPHPIKRGRGRPRKLLVKTPIGSKPSQRKKRKPIRFTKNHDASDNSLGSDNSDGRDNADILEDVDITKMIDGNDSCGSALEFDFENGNENKNESENESDAPEKNVVDEQEMTLNVTPESERTNKNGNMNLTVTPEGEHFALNGSGNGDDSVSGHANQDNGEAESNASSDEVEIIEVMKPYRGNPIPLEAITSADDLQDCRSSTMSPFEELELEY